MLITIDEVLDPVSGRVAFEAPMGSAFGYWRGGNPVTLGKFEVEFDLPGEVVTWRLGVCEAVGGSLEVAVDGRITLVGK